MRLVLRLRALGSRLRRVVTRRWHTDPARGFEMSRPKSPSPSAPRNQRRVRRRGGSSASGAGALAGKLRATRSALRDDSKARVPELAVRFWGRFSGARDLDL